jgi:hypothetical protein
MTDRPSLMSIDLWPLHESRCMQLLREALILLDDGPVDEGECDLNRRLYRSIIAAHTRAARDGAEQLPVVVPEGRNPPVESDAERAAREYKIPDFYWAYVDHLAEPGAARQFVVECKRLTKATKNWNYTEQYVHAGVLRFVTVEHAYGKDARAGAMVGYLQAMDVEQALAEINTSANAQGIAPLTIRRRPGDTLIELDHQLTRPFPDSPFLLMHIWTSGQERRQPGSSRRGKASTRTPDDPA